MTFQTLAVSDLATKRAVVLQTDFRLDKTRYTPTYARFII